MIHFLAPGACPQCHGHDDESCLECHPRQCTVCGAATEANGGWLCTRCEADLWPSVTQAGAQ